MFTIGLPLLEFQFIKLGKYLNPRCKSVLFNRTSVKHRIELKARHPDSRFLIVIEGVLMYFENDRVKTVVQNIAQRFSNSLLIFDVVSGWMCKNSHRHDTVKLTKVVFKFSCDDPKLLDQWSGNLHLKSRKLYCDFEAWRRAGLMNYFIMKIIPAIRTASSMLVYSIE